MRKTLIIFVWLMMALQLTAGSQSVYYLKYKFNAANDSTIYHSILVAYEYGGGFVRVRYTQPVTQEDVLVEMDLSQEDVMDASGIPDSTRISYKAVNPRTILGSAPACFAAPSFLFALNQTGEYYEPLSVSPLSCTENQQPGSFLVASFKERKELTRPFIRQFFSEDDEFYNELYTTSTRGLTALEKNIRMHIILVGDIKDKKIGPACAGDIEKVSALYQSLADFLGIKYVSVTKLTGNKFSIDNVKAAVNNLKPSSEDIVVFYYSGHGFRRPETPYRFPFMKLKSNDLTRRELMDNSLNIEEIFTLIRRKNARFNLVMSDCCNDEIESSNSTGSRIGRLRSSGLNWSEANCKKLFMNPEPMSVLATGADRDQRSSSNNTFGSFFTYFFKAAMENYFAPKNKFVTWDLVLQDTKAKTTHKANYTYCEGSTRPRGACFQEPYYKIIFGR